MKKLFVIALSLFFIVGLASISSACGIYGCAPTTVVNQGGSYVVQGPSHGLTGAGVIGADLNWCGPSFGFLNIDGAITKGRGMVGGTNTFISVSPGFMGFMTHGYTLNGNTYSQGFADGKNTTAASQAWLNDVNMTTHDTYHKDVTKVSCNHCGGSFKMKSINENTFTHHVGYDFGAVAGGSLRGPGSFQTQAGVNYTKIGWGK